MEVLLFARGAYVRMIGGEMALLTVVPVTDPIRMTKQCKVCHIFVEPLNPDRVDREGQRYHKRCLQQVENVEQLAFKFVPDIFC